MKGGVAPVELAELIWGDLEHALILDVAQASTYFVCLCPVLVM